MKETNRYIYLLLFALAIAVNFSGIFTPFFSDDPGLYASISKNLLHSHSFFELFTYNQDWLDKPHFPFWCVLLSFKLFGVSEWAYRLPALLFYLISVWYTYKFTKKFYTEEVAICAVLILSTALHLIISNTDVRAEPYLMALIIGGIYHISNLEIKFSWFSLFMAALFTACAIMTKGIFVIVAIYGSLFGQLLIQNKLRQLFNPKFIALYLLTILFVLPEIYALYIQFDLHPEKLVFGRHNVSGIKWFLWDSQFGRFVNSGPIIRKSGGSIFFFLHTLLWAFAPWGLLFYLALSQQIKSLITKIRLPAYYALSGGLLFLVLFSVSGFQLPFYTNAVFPLFAIITAPVCLAQLNQLCSKLRAVFQWVFIIVIPLLVLAVNYFLQPANNLFFIIGCIAFLGLIMLIYFTVSNVLSKTFMLTVSAALFLGFYLNLFFFKEVAKYNGQMAAANYANLKPFEGFNIYSLNAENNMFQFYCHQPVQILSVNDFKNAKTYSNSIIYVNQRSLNALKEQDVHFKIIRSFLNYPQENILLKFINKATREQVFDHVYLIYKTK